MCPQNLKIWVFFIEQSSGRDEHANATMNTISSNKIVIEQGDMGVTNGISQPSLAYENQVKIVLKC